MKAAHNDGGPRLARQAQNGALETLADELLSAPQLLTDDEAEHIVEEAEQLLREAAPHDYEVLVIGGGAGGCAAALRAAQLGARVGLVEMHEIGGASLSHGSVPTKTLLECVDILRIAHRASEYGVLIESPASLDFAVMHRRKDKVVQNQRKNLQNLLAQNQVEVLCAEGRFTDHHTVEITAQDGQTRAVRAVHIIIATGSQPMRPAIAGGDLRGVVTCDQLLQSHDIPQRLAIIGSGAAAIEFAYLYQTLGASVTLLEPSRRILPHEDEDIGIEMGRVLETLGVEIACRIELSSIRQSKNLLSIRYKQDGANEVIEADRVLMASARRAATQNLGLDSVDIEHDEGRIFVDDEFQTNISGVYAIGDCIHAGNGDNWAHLAAAEGKLVVERALGFPSSIALHFVPSCYYTFPQIASVGLTQSEAEAMTLPAQVGRCYFRDGQLSPDDAAEHDGFVKVVVNEQDHGLLGCQIIGPLASELINEAVVALKEGQTVEELAGAIHAHPTLSEALPAAALSALRSKI